MRRFVAPRAEAYARTRETSINDLSESIHEPATIDFKGVAGTDRIDSVHVKFGQARN